MGYGRLINAVVLGRVVGYIDFAVELVGHLTGVDEQNLAAITQPLAAAKMAASNVQQHYIMGKELSTKEGFGGHASIE